MVPVSIIEDGDYVISENVKAFGPEEMGRAHPILAKFDGQDGPLLGQFRCPP
jgi:hypothetical protein